MRAALAIVALVALGIAVPLLLLNAGGGSHGLTTVPVTTRTAP